MKKRFPYFFSITRLAVYLLVMFSFFLIVILQLYKIQIKEHTEWVELGKKKYKESQKVTRRRGDIFDSKMNKLATSEPVYSVFTDPKQVFKNREKFTTACSEILGLDAQKLIERISRNKKSRFMWLKRNLAENEYSALKEKRKQGLNGIYFKREFSRSFPESHLAAQLIGFVGVDRNDVMDNKGLEGLEYMCNDIINGKFVYVPQKKQMDFEEDQSPSIVLTIDSVIQHICEKALRAACLEYEAINGQIVVMEPSTGKVLAMANYPFYDPNSYSSFSKSIYKNRIITDVFEPGSTFKTITVAAAIDSGAVKEDEIFVCEGNIIVDAGKPVKCNTAHGEILPGDIIAFSCNPGIIQIGFKLGKDKLYEYIQKFGFLEHTGLDFPGEASTILKHYDNWYSRDFASICFGNAISTTGLHLTQSFAAIANKGILMKPILIEKIVNKKGETIEEFKPQIIRKVISPAAAEQVKRMLTSVVEIGTGKRAQIRGYGVAGKTGTPQKPSKQGGYTEDTYISLFLGMIPAEDPRIVAYIHLNETKSELGYGGSKVAAPIFNEIGEKIMRYLEIFPETGPSEQEEEMVIKKTPLLTPNYIGYSLKEVELSRKTSNLSIKLRGEGELVIYQLPKADTPISEKTKINLYLGERSLYDKLHSKGRDKMPSFIGKTLKEVINLLKGWENKVTILGHGMVESQYPPVGTNITLTTEIEIFLSSESERNNETYTDTGEIQQPENH